MNKLSATVLISIFSLNTSAVTISNGKSEKCVIDPSDQTPICTGEDVLKLGYVQGGPNSWHGVVVGSITNIEPGKNLIKDLKVVEINPVLFFGSKEQVQEVTPYKQLKLKHMSNYSLIDTEFIGEKIEKRLFKIVDSYDGIRIGSTIFLEGDYTKYNVELVGEGALLLSKADKQSISANMKDILLREASIGDSSNRVLNSSSFQIHARSDLDSKGKAMVAI
ncbi:MAG TPA: hypothetical protein PLJ21_12630, partial [Pseudobdellovibrionaceae bacterium]|nr:hypothetical protein [Pseudobdellovibrionaceae bacterium]